MMRRMAAFGLALWLSGAAWGGPRDEALRVLDAYAKHQERIGRISVQFEYEKKLRARLRGIPYADGRQQWDLYSHGDFSTDGERVLLRTHEWGQYPGNELRPKKLTRFEVKLWDGEQKYEYAEDPHPDVRFPNSGYIKRGEREEVDNAYNGRHPYLWSSGTPGSPAQGHMWGYLQRTALRIDEEMREPGALSVRDNMETVADVECHVVKAATARGAFTVWFAPDRDFNIVKATIELGEGDSFNENTLVKGDGFERVYTVLRFAKIDGLWVPKETRMEGHDFYGYGKYFERWVENYRRTSIELNPDFDARRTFEMTDVKNGSLWHIRGMPQIEYLWQDGKLVPR